MVKKLTITQEDIIYFYENKFLQNVLKFDSGTFIHFTSEIDSKITALGIAKGNKIILAETYKNKNLSGFLPKDVLQLFYFNVLDDEDIMLVTALGAAGTGKTTIAIAKALSDYFNYGKKIYLCKPTVMVQSHQNNVFGPVPGDIKEKYAPYLGSFEIVLNKVMGENSKNYLDMMFQKKHIEFMPVEFTRGCTFENCTFILDEVQNLSWHELKTVLSRIGESSKIILCGDPHQIDTNTDYNETGLCKLISSNTYKQSLFTASILLKKQYRGKIPDLIYHIDKENNDLPNKF